MAFYPTLLAAVAAAFLLNSKRVRKRLHLSSSSSEPEPEPEPYLYTNLSDVAAVLGGGLLQQQASTNTRGAAITPLESRALPNQRLVEAFGIDNAFTTWDVAYHRGFLKRVVSIINSGSFRMPWIAERAQQLARTKLYNIENANGEGGEDGKEMLEVRLVSFVQTFVLQIMLEGVMSCPELDQYGDTLQSIAEKINYLWLVSKSAEKVSTARTKHVRDALREELMKLPTGHDFKWKVDAAGGKDEDEDEVEVEVEDGDGDEDEFGPRRSNPLNLVVPAYETLWRIVLRCFLEVHIRSNEDWLTLFEHFLKSPSESFASSEALPSSSSSSSSYTHAVSVEAIVKEAFRLYPPTRRIYRAIRRNTGPADEEDKQGEVVGVDIEAIHRSTELWGDDANRFRPERWTERRAPKEAYLPFGAHKFRCPAETTFAPVMVGVCVGALVGALKGWEVHGMEQAEEEGEEKEEVDTEPLRNGRYDFDAVVLRRR